MKTKMKTFKIACQHCQQHIEAPVDLAGQVIKCPACEKPFVAPKVPWPKWITPLILIVAGLLAEYMPLPGEYDLSQWGGILSITGGVLVLWGMARLLWCGFLSIVRIVKATH